MSCPLFPLGNTKNTTFIELNPKKFIQCNIASANSSKQHFLELHGDALFPKERLVRNMDEIGLCMTYWQKFGGLGTFPKA